MHWQILFVHVYMVEGLFIILQIPTKIIRCLHLRRLAKLRQMLMQVYYPFEFHILLSANYEALFINLETYYVKTSLILLYITPCN